MTDDFDFDAWLAGASPATTSVDILQTPSLLGEWEDWQRRYKRAKATDPGEYSMGETNPVKALEAEGEALLARIEQSRSVWHIRPLTETDRKAIRKAFPEPELPESLQRKDSAPVAVESPTEAQAKAYVMAWEAYRTREQRWIEQHRQELSDYADEVRRNAEQAGCEMIARAVVRIEQAGRVIAQATADHPALTAAQVAQLAARIGEPQVDALTEAIERVGKERPEVPLGPLSHGSGSDPE